MYVFSFIFHYLLFVHHYSLICSMQFWCTCFCVSRKICCLVCYPEVCCLFWNSAVYTTLFRSIYMYIHKHIADIFLLKLGWEFFQSWTVKVVLCGKWKNAYLHVSVLVYLDWIFKLLYWLCFFFSMCRLLIEHGCFNTNFIEQSVVKEQCWLKIL